MYTSFEQIRDWLTYEEEMLRQQSVIVGDVDDILQVLDKQKVSTVIYFQNFIYKKCYLINIYTLRPTD